MRVHLLRDYHEHRDGKLIKHVAGAWVDVSKDIAEYLTHATLQRRQRLREIAGRISVTPEGQRK